MLHYIYIQENQSSASAGRSEATQLSSVSVPDSNTDSHNQLVMQQQRQMQHPTGDTTVRYHDIL